MARIYCVSFAEKPLEIAYYTFKAYEIEEIEAEIAYVKTQSPADYVYRWTHHEADDYGIDD